MADDDDDDDEITVYNLNPLVGRRGRPKSPSVLHNANLPPSMLQAPPLQPLPISKKGKLKKMKNKKKNKGEDSEEEDEDNSSGGEAWNIPDEEGAPVDGDKDKDKVVVEEEIVVLDEEDEDLEIVGEVNKVKLESDESEGIMARSKVRKRRTTKQFGNEEAGPSSRGIEQSARASATVPPEAGMSDTVGGSGRGKDPSPQRQETEDRNKSNEASSSHGQEQNEPITLKVSSHTQAEQDKQRKTTVTIRIETEPGMGPVNLKIINSTPNTSDSNVEVTNPLDFDFIPPAPGNEQGKIKRMPPPPPKLSEKRQDTREMSAQVRESIVNGERIPRSHDDVTRVRRESTNSEGRREGDSRSRSRHHRLSSRSRSHGERDRDRAYHRRAVMRDHSLETQVGQRQRVPKPLKMAQQILDTLKKCVRTKCKEEGITFADRRETTKHYKNEHNEKLCPVCYVPKSYTGHDWKEHLVKHHQKGEGTETAECPICTREVSFEGMYQHVARQHLMKLERRAKRNRERERSESEEEDDEEGKDSSEEEQESSDEESDSEEEPARSPSPRKVKDHGKSKSRPEGGSEKHKSKKRKDKDVRQTPWSSSASEEEELERRRNNNSESRDKDKAKNRSQLSSNRRESTEQRQEKERQREKDKNKNRHPEQKEGTEGRNDKDKNRNRERRESTEGRNDKDRNRQTERREKTEGRKEKDRNKHAERRESEEGRNRNRSPSPIASTSKACKTPPRPSNDKNNEPPSKKKKHHNPSPPRQKAQPQPQATKPTPSISPQLTQNQIPTIPRSKPGVNLSKPRPEGNSNVAAPYHLPPDLVFKFTAWYKQYRRMPNSAEVSKLSKDYGAPKDAISNFIEKRHKVEQEKVRNRV